MKINKEYVIGLFNKINLIFNKIGTNIWLFIESNINKIKQSNNFKKIVHLYRITYDSKYFNEYQWKIVCNAEKPDQEYLPKYWESLSNVNKEKWVVTYIRQDIQQKMREI